MINKIKNNRLIFMRIVVCIMISILSFGVFSISGFADDDKENDFSFYRVSSAIATYYDQTHNDATAAKDRIFKDDDWVKDPKNVGRAGAFVGFIDEDYDSGFFGSTVSHLSSSSQNRGYSTYNDPALKAYIQYGHALSAVGFDSTANVAIDFSSIVRALAGCIVAIFYTMAMSVEYIFDAVISILQSLNPFAWFLDSRYTADSPFIDWLSDAKDKGNIQSSLVGLTKVVSQWYRYLQDLGMIMIPIFLVCTVAGILLFRSSSQTPGGSIGSRIRKYLIRVVFIIAGIPLLGAMYTSALNSLLDSNKDGTRAPAANQVLASTFLDFESWSLSKKLALPEDVKFVMSGTQSAGGDIDLLNTTPLRDAALSINNMSNPKFVQIGSITASKSSDNADSATVELSDTSAVTSEEAITSAYSVIGRYTSSAFYGADNFETTYKAAMAGKNLGGGKVDPNRDGFLEGLWSWVTNTNGNVKKEDSLMDAISKDGDAEKFEEESRFSGDIGGPYLTDNSDGALVASINRGNITYSGDGAGQGLSTLSMYNYLTSKFGDSTVTTFSSHKVSSGLMRESHRSVNLIGNGFSKVLYYFYTIVIFISLTVIGWCYALAILFNMIKRGVAMIAGIPFALLGNLKAMAKVTTIVVMMIIEVIGTMFIYKLITELLLNLTSIFELPLQNLLRDNSGTIVPNFSTIIPGGIQGGLGSWAITLIVLCLSIVMYIVFTIWAVKYRKSFVKTMDEFAASMIDRIFSPTTMAAGAEGGVGSQYAGKKTLGDKLANAAKQTAGVAGGMLAANAIDRAIHGDRAGKNGLSKGDARFSGLSDGDAALAQGVDGDIDLESGGQGGIEGSEAQGLPDTNKPDGGGGGSAKSLEGGGGTKAEKEGQKLIANKSLGQNSTTNNTSNANSGSSGGHHTNNSSKDTGSKNDANKKDISGDDVVKVDSVTGVDNNGGVSIDDNVYNENTASDIRAKDMYKQNRKNGLSKAKSGFKQTVSGGLKAAAGYATGDKELAVEGVAMASGGVSNIKGGVNDHKNAADNTSAQLKRTGNARIDTNGNSRITSFASAINGGGRVQQAPETMSGVQLKSAAVATGSKQVTRMGSNERVATVGVAQNIMHRGGNEHMIQRSMSIAEGKTSTNTLRSQAAGIRNDVSRMRTAMKINPSASSYTVNGTRYTKDQLVENIQYREQEIAVRENAIEFRDARDMGRKKDKSVSNLGKKLLGTNKKDDYL